MNERQQNNDAWGWVLLAAIAWLALSGPTSSIAGSPNRVTLVVEEKAGVPAELRNAMRQHPPGLVVEVIDQHIEDGSGDVPERYRVALATADEHGVPILVIESDSDVSFVREPAESDILELWK